MRNNLRHRDLFSLFDTWPEEFGMFDSSISVMKPKNIDSKSSKVFYPMANVCKTDEAHTIELAVPGLSRSDISIQVRDHNLVVSADTKSDNDKAYVVSEFNYSNFKRAWKLPKDFDTSGITASYNSGILSIHIPKHKKSRSSYRKVEIS